MFRWSKGCEACEGSPIVIQRIFRVIPVSLCVKCARELIKEPRDCDQYAEFTILLEEEKKGQITPISAKLIRNFEIFFVEFYEAWLEKRKMKLKTSLNSCDSEGGSV